MKNLLTLISIILFFSCDNSTEPNNSEYGMYMDNFGGITETDENGNVITQDPSDWNCYSNSTVLNGITVVVGDDPLTSGLSAPSEFTIGCAYPNPTGNSTSITLSSPQDYNIEIFILDKNANKINNTL